MYLLMDWTFLLSDQMSFDPTDYEEEIKARWPLPALYVMDKVGWNAPGSFKYRFALKGQLF